MKCCLKAKGRGNWVHWNKTIKSNDLNANGTKISDIIVPTMDTARYKFLMDILISHNKPVMFVGPTGTGKSVYIKDKLMNELDRDHFIPAFLNFSAQTSAGQTQVCISLRYFFLYVLVVCYAKLILVITVYIFRVKILSSQLL